MCGPEGFSTGPWSDSGCGSAQIPKSFRAGLRRAHTLAVQASANPHRAKKLAAKAVRVLNDLKVTARKIAKQDECGDALGLMLTHAQDALARP